MLGHEAVRTLARDFEVHATVRDRAAAERYGLRAELHELDASSPGDLDRVLDAARPEVVLNCIGLVKQLAEASDPLQAIPLNSLFPHQAAEASRRSGAWLVHVSTDCVFSGDLQAPRRYTEDSVADARDLYGRSKLLGEVTAPALTLRTSIIGRELERSSGLLGWLEGQAGRTVKGFTEARFSGLTTHALSEVVAALIRSDGRPTGLYHVASEPIDKHEPGHAPERGARPGLHDRARRRASGQPGARRHPLPSRTPGSGCRAGTR